MIETSLLPIMKSMWSSGFGAVTTQLTRSWSGVVNTSSLGGSDCAGDPPSSRTARLPAAAREQADPQIGSRSPNPERTELAALVRRGLERVETSLPRADGVRRT
jgi:hypothetical protein